MSISEGLEVRHLDVIESNEADWKEESNQLEVPLIISNGSVLLERSKSKSDGNIGEESKVEPSNEAQFAGMKSRSVAGSRLWSSSRRCSQQKKEKTDRKNEVISIGWTVEKTVKFVQEDDKKDQHSKRYALFLQEHRSC